MDYLNLPTVVIVIIVAILVISNIINPTKNVISLIKSVYHSIINHFNQYKVFQEVLKTNQEAIKELSKKQDEDRAASKQGDKELRKELIEVKESLQECRDIILSVKIEDMRKTILDFASNTGNGRLYTKEQYNFVIKTYHDYENLIQKYKMTNDEVEISFKIIMEKFEESMRNSSFLDSHYKRNEDDKND